MREINGLLTQAKFTQALKNTNRYTLDNIPLGYHHSQLLNRVYLSTYENKKFNIISKHEY